MSTRAVADAGAGDGSVQDAGGGLTTKSLARLLLTPAVVSLFLWMIVPSR